MNKNVIFVISSNEYLKYAKAIYTDIIKYDKQNLDFYLFLSDENPVTPDFECNYISIKDLNIPYYNENKKKFKYGEMIVSFKPYICKWLLKKYSRVLYIDCDCYISNSFIDVIELLNDYSFILTPHITKSIPNDNEFPGDFDIIKSGLYNAGFFAVNNSTEATKILDWYENKLKFKCNIENYNEQIWLTLIPLLFNNVYILKNSGYNIAYWNLHERELKIKDNKFYVNNSKLIFYHFSGFDINNPNTLTKFSKKIQINDTLKTLIKKYIKKINT